MGSTTCQRQKATDKWKEWIEREREKIRDETRTTEPVNFTCHSKSIWVEKPKIVLPNELLKLWSILSDVQAKWAVWQPESKVCTTISKTFQHIAKTNKNSHC